MKKFVLLCMFAVMMVIANIPAFALANEIGYSPPAVYKLPASYTLGDTQILIQAQCTLDRQNVYDERPCCSSGEGHSLYNENAYLGALGDKSFIRPRDRPLTA